MNTCEISNPIRKFKIIELITDMLVNSTVNNKQLKTLSWIVCVQI